MTNVSAVTNHFPSAEEGFTTTLSSTISAGATTVGVNSLSGYTTGEIATFIVAPTVASEKQVFTGIVDTAGLQLTNVVWTTGTNQTHAAGTTVVDYVTATHQSQTSKGILVQHNQDGTHGAVTATSVASSGAVSGTTGTFSSDITEKGTTLTTMRDELGYDYVASGGVWSGDAYGSTRNASMTALVCYINGQRGTISAVTARSFTASKDTYIDVLNNSGTFSLVYTEVTNNAASPALAANSLRLGIVVTGASNIASSASINQGQPEKTVPTTCNLGQSGIDSLGNKICRRFPHRPLTFTFFNSLQGTGNIDLGTIPILTNAEVVITGGITARGVGAAPDVATYGRLYFDGTLRQEQRVDVQSSVAEPSYSFAWQGSTTAGSRLVRINTATNAGALSHIGYSFKVEVYA